jgi:hypothetical protein
LEGIETAARVICEESPNLSSFGKVDTNLYASWVISIPFCQMRNFLKSFIRIHLLQIAPSPKIEKGKKTFKNVFFPMYSLREA